MSSPLPSSGRCSWVYGAAGAAALTVAILVVTHLPEQAISKTNLLQRHDKLLHGVAYGALALLLLTAAPIDNPVWHSVVVLLLVGVIGMVDEMTQPLVGRQCSLADWISDMAGASGAIGLFYAARGLLQRRIARHAS